MKKRIVLWLCMLLMMTLTACGNKNDAADKEGEAPESVSIDAEDSADLLTQIWEIFPEESRFPLSGGNYENMVNDGAGNLDVSKTEELDVLLGMPADGAAMIDGAASMLHMMNANTFTAGAYHLKADSDMQTVADLLKENILNRQWMCGFPETLLIASVGDAYLVSAFGNGQIMEEFKTALQEKYEVTEIIYEENLL